MIFTKLFGKNLINYELNLKLLKNRKRYKLNLPDLYQYSLQKCSISAMNSLTLNCRKNKIYQK